MSSICLIDTSIFLEFLNVPNYNQHRESILDNYNTYVQAGYSILLPMATILETGNHIAQNGDGRVRRKVAMRFVEVVKDVFANKSPWKTTTFPTTQEILIWIDQFPDMAGRSKGNKKQEGTSFGDLSIIQEFDKACNLFSMSEVFIW